MVELEEDSSEEDMVELDDEPMEEEAPEGEDMVEIDDEPMEAKSGAVIEPKLLRSIDSVIDTLLKN